jgi:hypothetical protein
MSRAQVQQTLAARSGPSCVIPLLGEHAAALEQVPPDALALNPEVQARALRNAQALYELDGVVLGADEQWLAAAAWVSAKPGTTPADARRRLAADDVLPDLPPADTVLASVPVTALVDAQRRLRPVLGDRAAVGVVVPDPSRLAHHIRRPEAAGWTQDLLIAAIRLLGTQEPDFMLLVGDEHAGTPTLDNLAGFFGVPLVHVCDAARCQPGVIALPANDPPSWGSLREDAAWLYTTAGPLGAGADPTAVKAAIQQVRS